MNLTTLVMSLFNNGRKNKKTKEGYFGSNRERLTYQKNLNMSRREFFLLDWNKNKLTRAMYSKYMDTSGYDRTGQDSALNYSYFINN